MEAAGVEIQDLLKLIISKGASDLHLSAGSVPYLRVDGTLAALTDYPVLSAPETRRLALSLLTTPQQYQSLEQNGDIDFSFAVSGLSRFRCSIYTQRGALSVVVRAIPFRIPSFTELGLPAILKELAGRSQGLVLITGAAGSGKSTTLAALVDVINDSAAKHIVTIEESIEFIHRHRRAVVDQREVVSDTPSLSRALRSVLHHDPDVVVIGDLRDADTVLAALTLAETGHLVFGTLHSHSCVQVVPRLVELFPSEQQRQVRLRLAMILEGILSQTLIPRLGGGRALAFELLTAVPVVRALIRDDEIDRLYAVMQAGEEGMRTLNRSLADLVRQGHISRDDAFARSPAPAELASLLGA